ncbi:hypothetical protein DL771_010079 [Monosporascus sp. 5C6A]|nr:hypothetical protein DL771_010079 [Monosporascus sp. 5C6A]
MATESLPPQRWELIAHFWESYSHGKSNEDTPEDPAFRDRVLSIMQGLEVENPAPSTFTTHGYVRPEGPGINPDLFNKH